MDIGQMKNNDLDEINRQLELAEFLKAFKPEAEQYANKKDDICELYSRSYDDVKRQWDDLNDKIEGLRCAITNRFPNWRDLITKAICPTLIKINDISRHIDDRLESQKGEHERARDIAIGKERMAADHYSKWKNAAQIIHAYMTDYKPLIDEIEDLISNNDDRAFSIYKFWFDLLPMHRRHGPKTDKVGEQDTFEVLCPTSKPEDSNRLEASQHHSPATKTEGGNGADKPAPPEPVDPGEPWLVIPNDYLKELEDAYRYWRKTGDDLAEAQAEFKNIPDDIDSERKRLDELNAGKIDKIKSMLKDAASADASSSARFPSRSSKVTGSMAK